MKRNVFRFLSVAAAAAVLTVGFHRNRRPGPGRRRKVDGEQGDALLFTARQPLFPAGAAANGAAAEPGTLQPQPAGGGFFRSMAGGIVGGMLGGMLFRSLGFGRGRDGRKRHRPLRDSPHRRYRLHDLPDGQEEEGGIAAQGGNDQGSFRQSYAPPEQTYDIPRQGYAQPPQLEPADIDAGLAHIRQMDAAFDENRFNDSVMDMFFKIQGAWMNRDLAPVTGIMTEEMRRIFQEDIDRMLREKRVNRLENIAVRNVEIVEAWQETGQDFLTVLIYANLLDYTTDDATGQVVSGSKTDPVKFEEYWTFTRPVGNNPWKLSAINQK